jgi:hypothetical protein
LKIAAPAKQGSPHYWQVSKARTLSRELHVAFKIPHLYDFFYKIMQAASRSHTKSWQ